MFAPDYTVLARIIQAMAPIPDSELGSMVRLFQPLHLPKGAFLSTQVINPPPSASW